MGVWLGLATSEHDICKSQRGSGYFLADNFSGKEIMSNYRTHPEFFLARKNKIQKFSFSVRGQHLGNIMSRHRTTYNRERSKSTPACNLHPKRNRDVQIFGHDISSHRRAPPHVNQQNASANLQCSQCSPNNKIDHNRLIIGKSQE